MGDIPTLYALTKEAVAVPELGAKIQEGAHLAFAEDLDPEITEGTIEFLSKENRIFLFASMGSMQQGNNCAIPNLYHRLLYAEGEVRTFQGKKLALIIGGGFSKCESREYKKLIDDKENVRFTQSEPYTKLFPKVHVVLHHGGAGTQTDTVKGGAFSIILVCVDGIDQKENGEYAE